MSRASSTASGGASDPRLLVLHALRLKGFADEEAISRSAGLKPAAVAKELAAIAGSGLATKREGRITGWALTPDGRAAHGEAVEAELEAAGCRDVIDKSYRSFLDVNTAMLGVCTDWQLRADRAPEQVPNDHSDSDYDRAVIARLGTIDDAVQPICSDLGSALARFGRYGSRLAEARAKVEAGEIDWFTRPLIDSYHTVWFELHEDLLCTLGIDRASEGAP